jgi:cytochrome c oxidase assembly factor CtaG
VGLLTWLWALGCTLWVGSYEGALFMRHGGSWPWFRRLSWWSAGALLALAGLPPVASRAEHVVWVAAVQFGALLFGVAPLAAIGAPLAAFGPSRQARPGKPRPGRAKRSWRREVRLPPWRGWLGIGAFWVLLVGWRVPAAVDALAADRAWLWLEAASLVAGGWVFWSALIGSPPWLALHQRPRRMALAAVATWSTWIFAYVVGFSTRPFYPAYAKEASPMASQELSVGVLWAMSTIAFVPVIFANLLRWLRSEELLGRFPGLSGTPPPGSHHFGRHVPSPRPSLERPGGL